MTSQSSIYIHAQDKLLMKNTLIPILSVFCFYANGQEQDTIRLKMEVSKAQSTMIGQDSSYRNRVLDYTKDRFKYKQSLKKEFGEVLFFKEVRTEAQMQRIQEVVEVNHAGSFAFESMTVQIDAVETLQPDLRETVAVHPERDESNNRLSKRTNSRYDSRYDLVELDILKAFNLAVISNSFSVFAVVDKNSLTKNEDGSYTISNPQKAQDKFKLCSSEPYHQQVSIAIGTAFLIGKRTMTTALHILNQVPLKSMAFVSRFKLLDVRGGSNINFRANEIFFPQKNISEGWLDELDIAVVRVSQATDEYQPLSIDFESDKDKGKKIYSLGHPLGLPIKFLTNASIVQNINELYAETTLDTYQGSSGSPVFDSETHKVIGILVGGSYDFDVLGNCYVSRICQPATCVKEKIALFCQLKNVLKELNE